MHIGERPRPDLHVHNPSRFEVLDVVLMRPKAVRHVPNTNTDRTGENNRAAHLGLARPIPTAGRHQFGDPAK